MKYFMKKNWISVVVGVILLIVPYILNGISNNNYEQDLFSFNSYNVQAQIEEDGGLWITETINVTFDRQAEGAFYRDVVTSKNNNGQTANTSTFVTSDAKMRIMKSNGDVVYDSSTGITDSKVVKYVGYSWKDDRDDLGKSVKCASEYGSNCECFFSYVPAASYPTRIYEFTYHYEGAVSTYKDISELNWNFFDNSKNSVSVRNVDVSIKFPTAIANTDNIYFYGHGSNGSLTSLTGEEVKFSIDKLLPSHVVECRILFPTLGKANVAEKNYQDTNKLQYFLDAEAAIQKGDVTENVINVISLIVGIAGVLAVIGLSYLAYRKFDKELKPNFDSEYYRELPATYPPCEMGYLINFRDLEKNDLSATLMDLVRRGFIRIDYEGQSLTAKNPNYTMVYDPTKDTSSLKSYEVYLLKWFFQTIGQDNVLTLDELDNYCRKNANAETYKNCNDRWVHMAKNEASKNDFFDKSAEKGSLRYVGYAASIVVLGVLLVILGLGGKVFALYVSGPVLCSSVIMLSYCKHIKRRSKQGNEEYTMWMAFKHFLEEFSHFEDYPMPSIEIWQHYMVYAVSFGIADLVEKQLRFKFKDTKLPEEYEKQFYGYSRFNTYMILRMNRTYVYAATSLQQVRAAKVSSSGGRGGFGGGRSFGGGGGGARGR